MPKTPPKVKTDPKKADAAKAEPLSEFVGCSLRELPPDSLLEAGEIAYGENPSNRPDATQVLKLVPDTVDLPARIAVLTTKYWGNKGIKLGVWFDTGNSALKAKLLQYMNRWRTSNPKGANIWLTEASFGMSQIRVGFDNTGYWSYLGTDCLASFLAGKPTMNFQGFTVNTPESEYKRVVTHELGHAAGFPHEHMRQALINRLDRQKTIAYFMNTQGWSQQEVIQQVLTPLNESNLISSGEADGTSIMTYQLPGTITKDGQPIPGGIDINAADYEFVSRIYPPSGPVVPPPPPPAGGKWAFTARFEVDEATNQPKFVGFNQ